MARLYDFDDNPDRKKFLDQLLRFMEEKGSPISACPTISKNPLDLFRLYLLVRDRGGFVEVTKNKAWKDVATSLGIGASSSAAYTLRKHYTKNLFPWECKFDRGGIDPGPIINQVSSGNVSLRPLPLRPPWIFISFLSVSINNEPIEWMHLHLDSVHIGLLLMKRCRQRTEWYRQWTIGQVA